MTKKRKTRIKQNITDNLTLCRLKGDLFAVEANIRETNHKATPSDEGSRVKKFINGILNEITNATKSFTSEKESNYDRDRAQNAIKSFRLAHDQKDLAISEKPEEFKKYMDKHLFKKDADGIGRISFALVFAIDERNHEYQCPVESLEVVSELIFDDARRLGKLYSIYKNNYVKLQRTFPTDLEGGIGASIGSVINKLPASMAGMLSRVGMAINQKATNKALANMSANETNSLLAFRLTLIEVTKDLSEQRRKELINDMLEYIGNIRSDAEYRWYVEKDNIPECRDKIESCNLALARLGKIVSA